MPARVGGTHYLKLHCAKPQEKLVRIKLPETRFEKIFAEGPAVGGDLLRRALWSFEKIFAEGHQVLEMESLYYLPQGHMNLFIEGLSEETAIGFTSFIPQDLGPVTKVPTTGSVHGFALARRDTGSGTAAQEAQHQWVLNIKGSWEPRFEGDLPVMELHFSSAWADGITPEGKYRVDARQGRLLASNVSRERDDLTEMVRRLAQFNQRGATEPLRLKEDGKDSQGVVFITTVASGVRPLRGDQSNCFLFFPKVQPDGNWELDLQISDLTRKSLAADFRVLAEMRAPDADTAPKIASVLPEKEQMEWVFSALECKVGGARLLAWAIPRFLQSLDGKGYTTEFARSPNNKQRLRSLLKDKSIGTQADTSTFNRLRRNVYDFIAAKWNEEALLLAEELHRSQQPSPEAETLDTLAVALNSNSQFSRAEGVAREAVRLEPSHGGYHSEIAVALSEQAKLGQKKWDEALEAWQKVLKLSPSYFEEDLLSESRKPLHELTIQEAKKAQGRPDPPPK